KPGLMQKRYLATPQSAGGLLTVAVIGFVIGSLVAGAIGAGVILGNTTGVAANIQIVPNAPAVAMAFSPQTFQVAAGGTVTWINKDTMAHTVTYNTTGLFGSSVLTPGASWSHLFTQTGTFYYHCEPHRQMWGVVVVSLVPLPCQALLEFGDRLPGFRERPRLLGCSACLPVFVVFGF